MPISRVPSIVTRTDQNGQFSSDTLGITDQFQANDPKTDQSAEGFLRNDPKTDQSITLTLDRDVWDRISPTMTINSLAKDLGISHEAARLRLKKMEDNGLIIKINDYPIFYKKRRDLPRDKTFTFVEAHKIKVKLPVKGKLDKFKTFRDNLRDESKLTNWTMKKFHLGGVNFQVTTRSLLFHVTGCGLTPQDAIDNAKQHAVEIRLEFEKRFGLALAFPEFLTTKAKPDYVPRKGTKEQFEKGQRVWNDHSHDDFWETDDPLLAQAISDAIDVSSKFANLEAKVTGIDQIRQDINNLRTDMKQLVGALSSLVDALKPTTSTTPPSNTPQPQPRGYI